MSLDSFKVDIVHFLNPYVIWIQRKNESIDRNDEFLLEQVGVYGILPLELTIDADNITLNTQETSDWLPAAANLMKQFISDSTEIWFTPTHIDRRISIFDNNLHTYGDFKIKKNNKFTILSKQLIDTGFAYEDICNFHFNLNNGKIKTRLDIIETQEVIRKFVKYYKLKGVPENVYKKFLMKQMSVYFCTKQIESALTESNLEKHNNLMLQKILDKKMKDLEMCKDVDDITVGRASKKKEDSKSDISSSFVKRMLQCERSNKIQSAVETFNNVKKYLENNSTTYNDYKIPFVDDNNTASSSGSNLNMKSSRLLKLNALAKATKNTNALRYENKVHKDGITKAMDVKTENFESNESVKQYKKQLVTSKQCLIGPPGLKTLQHKVNVSKPESYNNNKLRTTTQTQQINKEIIMQDEAEEQFELKTSGMDSEVNINNVDTDGKILINLKKVGLEKKNRSISSSSSYLEQRLKLSEKRQKIDSNSDTTNKDTSTIDTCNSNYSKTCDTDELNEKNGYGDVFTTKLKSHVNPFRNIDPNISVFVDRLVTAILMVHSKLNKRIEPIYEIRDVNFNRHIHMTLRNMSIRHPMMLQSVSWSTILRNYSLFIIGPVDSGKTMGYLPAVCRLITDEKNSGIIDGLGPISIIVCATAESASNVEEKAKMFLGTCERIVTYYAGIPFVSVATRLLNGCDLLICTPPALAHLLQVPEYSVDLRRLCTFVLDDCERLDVVYSNEIKLFLHKIKEMLKHRIYKECKVQFILASRIWCDFMVSLAKKAPDTVICISAFQECVLYSKANISIDFVKSANKINYVKEFLNGSSKKTVIVCREDGEVKILTKTLQKSDNFIFECDSTMTVQDLYNISVSWTAFENSLVRPLLICCDGNLTHMNITDAHNLLHFSMPPLFSLFCKRFSVLNDNYPSIFETVKENVRIKVLLDEDNTEQLPKIIHFIKRCSESVPDILNRISEKVIIEKDEIKAKNFVPLCNNLLGLGSCQDFQNCRERHTIFKDYDTPKDWLPKNGVVTFNILHYHSAVRYSAKLLSNIVNGMTKKYSQTYNSLSTKLGMYYSKATNRKLHGIPKVGDICAVLIKQDFFVRCQVIKIINPSENKNSFHVLVNLIDEEKYEITRDINLYYLPDDMKMVETCTVQVRLANIQPRDRDITFTSLAIDHLKKIIESDSQTDSLYLKGNICLVIGNCIFIENLEACQDLISLNQTVTQYNLKRELLEHYAILNVDHFTYLKKLCFDCGIQMDDQFEVPKSMNSKKYVPTGYWAHLDKDDVSRVYFASALSPDNFFVRLEKFDSCMTNLTKEIQNYVLENNLESITTIAKGNFILAQFPDDLKYERARVDEVYGDEVKCFFVDQGDWRNVSVDKVLDIPNDYINRLPFQAIECRLIGVKPPGEEWTDFSTNWLCDNCLLDDSGNLKSLYVKYFTKEPAEFTSGHRYGIALIDTNTENDIIINNLMVDLNLCQQNDNEIHYLTNIDFGTKESDQTESLDDDEWEKVAKSSCVSDNKSEIPLHILMQQPIRSVPLVGSDEESDDSDKWNINMIEDFKCFFQPVVNKITDQKTSNLIPIQNVLTEKNNSSDENYKKSNVQLDSYQIEPKMEMPKIIELDSDDLTNTDVSASSSENTDKCEKIQVPELRRPKLVWQNNKTSINIKIQIVGAEVYELIIEERQLKFKACVDDIEYGFEIELYGIINKDKCTHAYKGQYILVKLIKVLQKTWPILTKHGGIKSWITYDIDNIDTSSDEEVLDRYPFENIVKNIHYAADSDTDCEDFGDDVA